MKKQFARTLMAAILSEMLALGPALPVFAQEPTPSPSQEPGPAKTAATAPPSAPIPVSLGVAKYHFTRAPRPFPNLIDPYRPIHVDHLGLTNSPRIDQLIHDGKLELTLQDAVELALENSMDIVVQRYNPWFADLGILKAEAGGFGGAVPGAAFGGSTANNPFINFDPTLTTVLTIDDSKFPINNALKSGTG
ncbi:MAG: hypothetical protein ACRD36_03045, partial [Candidatus Acidiferrum sp.]